jgi:hypothetical protein
MDDDYVYLDDRNFYDKDEEDSSKYQSKESGSYVNHSIEEL